MHQGRITRHENLFSGESNAFGIGTFFGELNLLT
jgi:hypothetical protein